MYDWRQFYYGGPGKISTITGVAAYYAAGGGSGGDTGNGPMASGIGGKGGVTNIAGGSGTVYTEKLNRKVKPKRGFVTQITKTQIAASQKWCCRICTTLFTGIFHMDHTIPLSFGGEDNLENVTALCVQCHAEKSQNEWKLRV